MVKFKVIPVIDSWHLTGGHVPSFIYDYHLDNTVFDSLEEAVHNAAEHIRKNYGSCNVSRHIGIETHFKLDNGREGIICVTQIDKDDE